MNYSIALHYIEILHRCYMLKYYQGLSLVSLNNISYHLIPFPHLRYCPHQNILNILQKYVYYLGHQSNRHHHPVHYYL